MLIESTSPPADPLAFLAEGVVFLAAGMFLVASTFLLVLLLVERFDALRRWRRR